MQLLDSTVLTEMWRGSFAVMSLINKLHCISFPLHAKIQHAEGLNSLVNR